MVAVLPSGTPGFRTGRAAPQPRREVTTGPPLCYRCWTRRNRVPDCKILTDKERQIVKAARSTFLRKRNAGVVTTPDRTTVVALLWNAMFGARSRRRRKGGASRPWQPRPRDAAGRKTPRGGDLSIPLNPPCPPQLPDCSPSRHVCLPGGNRDVARPGPMSLSSWAIPSAVLGDSVAVAT